MYYNLYSVSKRKTDIVGYWKQDNKVYLDYIKIDKHTKQTLRKAKKELFQQLAVFYRVGNKAIIENQKGEKQTLEKRLEFKYKKSYSNVKQIKAIINKYNGCTVYHKKGYIIIEVFTN